MLKNTALRIGMTAIAFGLLALTALKANASERAYVMILEEKKFDPVPHVYVALGQDRKSGVWNLPGGGKEKTDVSRGAAAARELFEETGKIVDKRGDVQFWSNLKSYEFNSHKVFLIAPGTINLQIANVDAAVKKNASNKALHYTLREMKAFTYIRLSDLVDAAHKQAPKNQWPTKWSKKLNKKVSVPPVTVYNHPTQGQMVLEPWMLYTIRKSHAGNGVLAAYSKK